MDTKTKEERSKNMSAIKNKDTKPELYLRALLFRHGFRYRKNSKLVPGHPDIWLRKYNTAIFVHGCFWHRHQGCKYSYMPKSRTEYWNKKFTDNVNRDKRIKEELLLNNIKCLVVWECTIKKKDDSLLDEISCFLVSGEKYKEI